MNLNRFTLMRYTVGMFKISFFFFLEYFTKNFSVSCVLVRTDYVVCQTYNHTYTSETAGNFLQMSIKCKSQ